VRRVRRYIEYNNIRLLVVGFEFFEIVAIIAIKNKQLIFTLRMRYYIEIKVLNPIYTFLISNLIIINYYNTLISRKVILLILISEVILPGQDNK